MKATINNTLLSQLKPKDKQYDVRDSKLKGFLIRVNPTGKMNYVCEFKRGRRINLGQVGIFTPAQARDRAIEILGDAAKGIDPVLTKKQISVLLLRSFIEKEYEPWVKAQRKTGLKTVSRIKGCFYKSFAEKPLTDITPILIDQWRTQRLKLGRTTETINRDVATFKAALSKAVEWGLINTHPLAKLKLFKADNSAKVRYLNDDEEQCLRMALHQREEEMFAARKRANQWREERSYNLLPLPSREQFIDHIKPMVLLSINTGIRQGELFSLQWQNINFDTKTLTIEGKLAKSGKTRHVPLNNEAFSVLQKWHKTTSNNQLVFPNRDGKKFDNVKKAWANLLKTAEVNNFRWHDMRHHFASRLVMAGVDLNTVRELLGHSDIKMTLRYAHLAPEHKAEAVAKLDKEKNLITHNNKENTCQEKQFI